MSQRWPGPVERYGAARIIVTSHNKDFPHKDLPSPSSAHAFGSRVEVVPAQTSLWLWLDAADPLQVCPTSTRHLPFHHDTSDNYARTQRGTYRETIRGRASPAGADGNDSKCECSDGWIRGSQRCWTEFPRLFSGSSSVGTLS